VYVASISLAMPNDWTVQEARTQQQNAPIGAHALQLDDETTHAIAYVRTKRAARSSGTGCRTQLKRQGNVGATGAPRTRPVSSLAGASSAAIGSCRPGIATASPRARTRCSGARSCPGATTPQRPLVGGHARIDICHRSIVVEVSIEIHIHGSIMCCMATKERNGTYRPGEGS
jgi:hypothetical protein